MNIYDASELSYNNGYVKGLEDGRLTQEQGMLARFEEIFGIHCTCGNYYFPHHMYCPHCGLELWQKE